MKKVKGKKTTEFDDFETVDYNNETSISDLINLKKKQRNTTGSWKNY